MEKSNESPCMISSAKTIVTRQGDPFAVRLSKRWHKDVQMDASSCVFVTI